jgi:hypothetical protein
MRFTLLMVALWITACAQAPAERYRVIEERREGVRSQRPFEPVRAPVGSEAPDAQQEKNLPPAPSWKEGEQEKKLDPSPSSETQPPLPREWERKGTGEEKKLPATPPSKPVPLEFHVQIAEQEHLAAAKGLGATIVYPRGLPVYHDRVEIVYEWRPVDGKEKRLNPRTQSAYGPIWRASVAEQMQPEHLARHLNTMGAWLDTYVPRDFEGVVCLDLERWSLLGDEFHLGLPQREALQRLAPGKRQADVMAEFMHATESRARELRPRVKAWGWWGMGGMHPAWPYWRPEQYKAWKRDGLALDAGSLTSMTTPMPVFYGLTVFPTDTQRAAGWEKVKEHWAALYGPQRLAQDGYAYLNITHPDGPRKGQALSAEEFRECIDAAWGLGMRRFVVWEVLESREKRDLIQRFLDGVLRPEVEARVRRVEASRATPPADAVPKPTRRD